MGCKSSKQDRLDASAKAYGTGDQAGKTTDVDRELTTVKDSDAGTQRTSTDAGTKDRINSPENNTNSEIADHPSKVDEIAEATSTQSSSDNIVCSVPSCQHSVALDHPGSPYCAQHEFEPVGQISFHETQQILIVFRESLGFEGWRHCFFDCKRGWSQLGYYETIEQLGTNVNGLEVKDGKLVWIDMRCCNLTGTIPPCIARLDTLTELWLGGNKLSGSLPANIGTPSCLPSLKRIHLLDAVATEEEHTETQEERNLTRAGSFIC
jgi:hypothetical protein